MVATIADLMVSPQYQERRFFETIEHPGTGPALYAGIPATFDGGRPPSRRAPLLGEHNEHIYRDVLQMDAGHLARLRAHAII
jgi:crotonobetainyl-CoA:carnitine CoA-transferase CaiB-like acyl-CoA transferase